MLWLKKELSSTSILELRILVSAYGKHDQVDIIANDQGNNTTPSYVVFTNTARFIEDVVKNQVIMNPINMIFDAKRLIGRRFSYPSM